VAPPDELTRHLALTTKGRASCPPLFHVRRSTWRERTERSTSVEPKASCAASLLLIRVGLSYRSSNGARRMTVNPFI
jgi:hypothetical protein